jgi:hypothetical protein
MKAFPVTIENYHEGDETAGMDLRDYFAAKAMQGMLSNQPTYSREITIDGDTLAQSAYQIADAMMKAREQ